MQAHRGTIVCKFGGDRFTFAVEEAILVQAEKCPYHVTFDADLDLEHTWTQARLRTIVCKFRGDRVTFVVEETILVQADKCKYHVIFDLDLDPDQTLDAGPPGDHPVQVSWRSRHVCGRRDDFSAGRQVQVSRDL